MANKLVKKFSNVVVYKVDTDKEGNHLNLAKILYEENFDNLKARPCGPNEISTIGFSPVITEESIDEVDEETGEVTTQIIREEEFVTTVNGYTLINIGLSNKKIPKKEVDKIVSQKISAYYAEAKEKGLEVEVSAKELKATFHDETVNELLPRAFSEETEVTLAHDTTNDFLYVFVPTYKKAEVITSFLRNFMPLPIFPVSTNDDPIDTLTDFVTSWIQDDITLGENLVMVKDKEKAAIKGESLYSSEVLSRINDSVFSVSKIQLIWKENTKFNIDATLQVSGIKYDKAVTCEAVDVKSTFLLCINEIKKSYDYLIDAMGGYFEMEEVEEDEEVS